MATQSAAAGRELAGQAGQVAGQTAGQMPTQAASQMPAQAAGQTVAQTAEQLAEQLPMDQLANQAAAVPSFSWSGYFMTIAVLCLFLTVLWFTLRWLKKRGSLRLFGGNQDIKLESRLNLGPKKTLLMVRLHDRRLLLGVTDHHIGKLAEIPLEYEEGEVRKKYSDYMEELEDAEEDKD